MSAPDQQLERLAEATGGIRPDVGFDDWIMQRISERAPAPRTRLASGILLSCFAAAALAAVLVSQVEQQELDTGALSVLDSLDAQ